MQHDIFDYHCTGCGSMFSVSVPSRKGMKVNYKPECPSCGHARNVNEGTPSHASAPIRESLQMGDGASQMKMF